MARLHELNHKYEDEPTEEASALLKSVIDYSNTQDPYLNVDAKVGDSIFHDLEVLETLQVNNGMTASPQKKKKVRKVGKSKKSKKEKLDTSMCSHAGIKVETPKKEKPEPLNHKIKRLATLRYREATPPWNVYIDVAK